MSQEEKDPVKAAIECFIILAVFVAFAWLVGYCNKA